MAFLSAILALGSFTGLVNAEGSTITSEEVKSEQAISSEMANETMFTESEITEEEAIEIVKAVIGDLEGYSEPRVHPSYDYYPFSKREIWEISWQKNGPTYSHISARVDANSGVLLSFYRNVNPEDYQFPASVKYEGAVELAREFLNNLLKDKGNEFILDERYPTYTTQILRNPWDTYSIRFLRVVNGIPFSNNIAYVGVDSKGNIVNYQYDSQDNVVFPEPTNIIPKDQVLQKLESNLSMELSYVINYNQYPSTEDPKVYVSYVPSNFSYNLNATSGEFIDYTGNPLVLDQKQNSPLAEEPKDGVATKLSTPLSKEEALEKINEKYNIPKEVIISSNRLVERNGSKVWEIQFEYRTFSGGTGWNGASVDSETGEILQFDINPYYSEKIRQEYFGKEFPTDKEFTITYEDAKELAEAFVKENMKDKLHQLYFSTQYINKPTVFEPFYRIQFVRKVEGILVPFNSIYVTISADTGDVVGFSQRWDDSLTLPKVENVISKEEAKKVFMSQLDLELEYQLVSSNYPYPYESQNSDASEPKQAYLAYRVVNKINQPAFLDAYTGKYLRYDTGKEVVGESTEELDILAEIKGHWAEKELQFFIETKVIKLEEGKLNLNEQMTRGQFIDLFMRVFEQWVPSYYTDFPETFKDVPKDHPYYTAVHWGIERGILVKSENFYPDQIITREEAAVLLVKSMGYDKIAKKAEIFNVPFKDKEKMKYLGEIALISAMGIMNGSGEYFYPEKELTKAEAAVLFYRLLENRMKYLPDVNLR